MTDNLAEQIGQALNADLIYRALIAELDHPQGYITKDPLTLDSVSIDVTVGCESIAEFLRNALRPRIQAALDQVRLEEAKWWRHLVIMDEDSYFTVEGDKRIRALEQRSKEEK